MRAYVDPVASWETFKERVFGWIEDRTTNTGRLERTDGSVLEFAVVPLPDGATLLIYFDVSDSERVQRALAERNAALETADRLKSEFLALYHDKHPYSLRDRMMTRPWIAGRMGVALSPLANGLLRAGWFRNLLEAVVGIDARRSLPPFAGETFESWFRRREPRRSSAGRKVVLFHDTFMTYQEPGVGKAAVAVLEAAGFEVCVPLEAHLCCGSAGTYNILQPEIAAKLGERKAANLNALEPDVIAAGNVGCATQIGSHSTIPVVHTVELLDWASGGPAPEALSRRD